MNSEHLERLRTIADGAPFTGNDVESLKAVLAERDELAAFKKTMSDLVTVIYFNEDGDLPLVKTIGTDLFLDRLKADYYGENPEFAKGREIDGACFHGLVVLKGGFIQP